MEVKVVVSCATNQGPGKDNKGKLSRMITQDDIIKAFNSFKNNLTISGRTNINQISNITGVGEEYRQKFDNKE